MRYLPSAALWLAVTGASLSGQIPAGESGRLQPLPLTQLDERALAAELDNRSFTLNRIEGAFIRVGQPRAAWPPSSRRAPSSSSC